MACGGKAREGEAVDEPILALRAVSKRFENSETFTLVDVNLSVDRQEFICILGPNGCGKSTLLNLIAGFKPYSPHSSGQVLIEGRPLEGPGTDRVVVFQEESLFPWLSVRENIEFGLRIKGVPVRERREISAHYLRLMGVEEFADMHPVKLSGGMKQKTELARAFALKPRILLLDEPFAKVDALTRYTLQEELLRVSRLEKCTVLFVTHSVQEAVFLGDRICVMTRRPGTILEEVRVDIPKPRKLSDTVTNRSFSALVSHLLAVAGEGGFGNAAV